MSGTADAQPLTIRVDDATTVSALWLASAKSESALVFAHGAGAGMHHRGMADLAREFADHGIASLRFQFPYMDRGSKRTDPPALCHATIRAAVRRARDIAPGLKLLAGGRSFGGRMTSQAQALAPLDGVVGLVFFAFPLHPAGKASIGRAEHLANVNVPMLFLQGTRDELAEVALLNSVVGDLAPRATVRWFDDADHSFHVRARSGHTDGGVRAEIVDCVVKWSRNLG